jgi:hypothetical protein
MGRKDLTRYGGGFRNPRPKDLSNAFLAEEDIDEVSVAGSIVGAPSTDDSRPTSRSAQGHLAKQSLAGVKTMSGTEKEITKKDSIMQEKEEERLRKHIRINLKKFFESKSQNYESDISGFLEEHYLRIYLRNVIFEQMLNEVEDPETDIHDSTGINTLKDLLKNTNVLATLRSTYKTLTTSEEQKVSFRAHIIQWVQDTLAPVKLNDAEELSEQQDDVGIDIEGVNDKKFIDAPDGSEKEQLPQDDEEDELTKLEGEDTTGRNKAERIYPNIEKSIVDFYGELDNPEDQEMFYDYLIANLKLYFDKWEGEMSFVTPQEPTNDQYNQAKETEDSPGLSAGI